MYVDRAGMFLSMLCISGYSSGISIASNNGEEKFWRSRWPMARRLASFLSLLVCKNELAALVQTC